MLKDKDTGKKHLDNDLDDYFKKKGTKAEAVAAAPKADEPTPMES